MDRATERQGRRRRLAIIVVVAVVVLGAGAVVQTIGGRRVDAEVSRVRTAARTATVDYGAFVFAMMNAVPDPMATALQTDADVSAVQGLDQSWCLTLEVTRLLSKRSVFFALGHGGALTEVAGCTA